MLTHKIEHSNFYANGLRLAFVPQTLNNEIAILIPAKQLMHGDKYYRSKGQGNPAVLTKWDYPWKVDEGYAILRLSEMNNHDGLTYCNFNINNYNMSDYQDEEYDKSIVTNLIELDQPFREKINKMVDMSSDLVYLDQKNNTFAFDIWNALIEGHCRFVRSNKYVFCIMPKRPSDLNGMDVSRMTDTEITIYHHIQKSLSKVQIGWRDGMIKIPCVDAGGLSNVCFTLNDDALYDKIFSGTNLYPSMYINVISFDQIYPWAKGKFNNYLKSRGIEPVYDDEFSHIFKSICNLYNKY